MPENDRICLTPDDQHDMIALMYQRTAAGRHSLETACSDMLLSNAEALTFARQLPEVEALVEALRALEPEHVSGSLTFRACTKCGATSHGRPLIHNSECPFAALAPFEEAPDA